MARCTLEVTHGEPVIDAAFAEVGTIIIVAAAAATAKTIRRFIISLIFGSSVFHVGFAGSVAGFKPLKSP